ncbi:MAG: hypothetical protein LBJ41_01870 [Treponema sp.]|jgi:hypothetical protein|nr:hypothetical protein [Treponema sp.]
MSDTVSAKLEIEADATGVEAAIKTFDNNIDRAKQGVVSLGKEMTKTFENSGKQVKVFGTSLQVLGKAGGVIATVVMAFQKMAGVITDAIAKSKQYREELELHKKSVEAINATYNSGAGSAENFWNALSEIETKTESMSTKFEIAMERMGGALSVFLKPVENIKNSFAALLFGVTETDVALRNMAKENQTSLENNVNATKKYESSLRQIEQLANDVAFITGDKDGATKAAQDAKYQANQTYITQLNNILDNLRQASNKDYEAIDYVRQKLALQVQLLGNQKEELAAYSKSYTAQEKITKQISTLQLYQEKVNQAQEDFAFSSKRLWDQAAHQQFDISDEINNQKIAQDQFNRLQLEYLEILERIANMHGVISVSQESELAIIRNRRDVILNLMSETEKEEKTANALLDISKKRKDIEEENYRIWIDYYNQLLLSGQSEEDNLETLKKRKDTEIELLHFQAEREKEAFKETDAYQTLLKTGDKAVKQWEHDFDEMVVNRVKIIENAYTLLVNKESDALMENFQKGVNTWNKFADATLEINRNMSNNRIDILNAELNESLKMIEDFYAEKKKKDDEDFQAIMDRYEKERQAELEKKGFMAAELEENLEAAMAAAIATGDEAIIYREERRQEELEINKRYDKLEKDEQDRKNKEEEEAEKQKNAEIEAAKKKTAQTINDIEYQQAMGSWLFSVMNHVVNTITGASKTLAELGIFGAAALPVFYTLMGVQAAALASAMPVKKPLAFAKGGIVDSPTAFSYSGVKDVGLMGEAGAEAILPLSRMNNGSLGVQASGGNAQYTTIDNLLGFMVKLYNDGYGDMIEGNRINNKT